VDARNGRPLRELMFEAAGLAVWSIEAGEERVELSAEMARLLGLKRRSLDLQPFIEAMAAPGDAARLAETIQTVRRTGKAQPIVHYTCSGKAIRALRTTFASSPGAALGAVAAATQDISEILGVSELRRRRIEQIARSTSASPGVVAMFDLDGKCRAASPGWEAIAGLCGRDYIGLSIEAVTPGASARTLELHRRAAGGENFIEPEQAVIDAQGLQRWLQYEYRPITAIDGQIIGYVMHGHDITPLVEARREALLNAERLRLALTAARAGVCSIDYRTNTFWCSPQFTEIVGRDMTFEEATAPAWPMTHPDDVERVHRQLVAGFGQEKPDPLELRLIMPSGEARWIQIQAENQIENGRIQTVTGFAIDIDVRKRQELQLIEARREAYENAERLGLALDAARAGVFETDFAQETFWCSAEFEEITGRALSFEQAAERVWFNVHPDDRAHVAEVVERGLETLKVGPFETRIVLPSGESRWIHMSSVVHRAPDGSVAKVVGLITDIDAKKRQELAFDEARRDAQANAERLRMALDAGQAGVFESDFAAKTFWCSPQFVQIMGRNLTFEEACSHAWPGTYPDDVEVIASRVKASIHAAPSDVAEPTLQTRVVLPDGTVRWIETFAELHRDGTGALQKVVGLVLNIDAHKRQEMELIEAQRAAEAATDAKSQFLANMSHEIRTPMNGVLGVLHLLEREPLTPAGLDLLAEAQACGQMLAQLLNDVIDFSKIEAGRLELSPEPLNVADTLQSVLGMLRPLAAEKGVELRAAVSAESGWILADPVRLRQALFNLVGNAVKFTNKGHVEVRLKLAEAAQGQLRVRFEIEDTGVGIAEDAQELLFQRFHQADGSTARRFGGSGLGLAITRSLAELMGGEVGFASQEGKGSTFWFDVPAPAAPPQERRTARAGAALDGLSVLVVEDNPTNRMVASKILEGLGATVVTAEDGVFGVEAVRAGRYDLVLMDVQMPRMDGVEATRQIRAMEGPAARTPIIGLTANALAHQRPTYLAAGMDGVAAKPISPAELLEEIANVLSSQDGETSADVA
jgi:PAS domain S-box-containing protein